MAFKFNFHISEDNYAHVLVVQKLAVPDGHLLSEADRKSVISEWFNFNWFQHPGKAIEWYDANKNVIPHLHIADIDFTELDLNPDVSKIYKKNTSGILTIRYLVDRFNTEECKIIPYSNNLDKESIVAALAEEGWDTETVLKVMSHTNKSFIKTRQPLLKRRIEDKLKSLAKREFSLMDEGLRSALYAEIGKGLYADWNEYILHYDNYDFYLRNMLAGWGDIRLKKKEDVSNIVEELLTDTHFTIEFSGWWESIPGNIIPKYLSDYWTNKAYFQNKTIINLRAIDVILDIMVIKDAYEETKTNISVSPYNKLFKVSEIVKGTQALRIFNDKLVARRVIIACSNMFYNSYNIFDQSTLCSLVCYHQTEKLVTDKNTQVLKERASGWVGTAFKNYFGLPREDKRVPIEIGKIMGEEYNFYKNYIENGVINELRKFLTEYDFSQGLTVLEQEKYKKLLEKNFTDLTHFKKFIHKIQMKEPILLNTLMDDVKDYTSPEVYKILSLSNPVFRI